MRTLVSILVCAASLSGLAVSFAQTPSPSPSASATYPDDTQPAPVAGFWIGWGELPWYLPQTTALNLTAMSTIRFSSPAVQTVLAKMGIILRPGSKGNSYIIGGWTKTNAPKPTKVADSLPEWIVTAESGTAPSDDWQEAINLPVVKTLDVADQSAIVRALLAAWTQFYTFVGAENLHNENHFGLLRKELLRRADKDGITPALLDDCRKYRAELQSFTNQ